MQHSHKFASSIVRAYDIRGIVDKDLHIEDAYYLAQSLAVLLYRDMHNNLSRRTRQPCACVGYDGRISSPRLHRKLIQGFLDSGISVIDIGLVTTPVLYFGAYHFATDIGIMVTASHNPMQYNGFKIVYNGLPLYADKLVEVVKIAADAQLSTETYQQGDTLHAPDYTQNNIIPLYTKYIHSRIPQLHHHSVAKLKIAWDPGNGSACSILPSLLSTVPGTHFVINKYIDGTFPAHPPDPAKPENMKQLVQTTLENNCDIGFAFDGDADRLSAVTKHGEVLYGEHLLLLLAHDLLKTHPGSKIIADVKTSQVVFNQIKNWGGYPIMWKTGHAFIKTKMFEEDVLLAGETSGHIMFRCGAYNADDAIFAACKVLDIVSNGIDIGFIMQPFSGVATTNELRYAVNVAADHTEQAKFLLITEIKRILDINGIKYHELDGVRVEEDNGWWLLRASNTESCITARAEAKDLFALQGIIHTVESIMSQALENILPVSTG